MKTHIVVTACIGIAATLLIKAALLPRKSVKSGIVIILNGSSARSKSTIQKALQSMFSQPWLNIDMDNFFLGILPERYRTQPSLQNSPEGNNVIKGMHQAVAAYAKAGNNIIVDYIAYQKDSLSNLVKSLQCVTCYLVHVTTELERFEEGWIYDFVIDSSKHTPIQSAKAIMEFIQHNKAPQACKRLQRLHKNDRIIDS